MSLDVICLFSHHESETQDNFIAALQNNNFGDTQHLILRYKDVDTPPPNFS